MLVPGESPGTFLCVRLVAGGGEISLNLPFFQYTDAFCHVAVIGVLTMHQCAMTMRTGSKLGR